MPWPQKPLYWWKLASVAVVVIAISGLFYGAEYIPRQVMLSPTHHLFLTNFNEPKTYTSSNMTNAATVGEEGLKNKHGKIYLIYHGRLGNNLFQYAMLLAARHLTGRPVYFICATNLSTIFQGISIPILKPSQTNLRNIPRKEEELPGTFNPNFIANIPSSDVVICCYFQSFKYFYFIRDTVRREFTFQKKIRNRADAILHRARIDRLGTSTLNSTRYIGIHVRRGDFTIRTLHQKGYRIPGLSYFKNAKRYFQERYSESLLFVVTSDDKAWVLRNLNETDTYISTSGSAVNDLALLAACNDTIMSLSTFSWWAGFLAGGETVYFKDHVKNGSVMDTVIRSDDRFLTPDWIPMGN